jgi:hypothetical protein
MYNLDQCEKVEIPQGSFYLGPSTKKQSVGYLELLPYTSLTLHNRETGVEKLTQVKGKSSMVVYDKPGGRIVTLNEKDTLSIDPPGIWHIHANPFDIKSLTYWDFAGDIRNIIDNIRQGAE